MIFLGIAASGYLAYEFFNDSVSLNESDSIAEDLTAFPARKTAYKIGMLSAKIVFFWAGLNCLAVCGFSIYSAATSQALVITCLFMEAIGISSILSLGMFAISISFLLYARPWQMIPERG